MSASQRSKLSLTDSGLIRVAANPTAVIGQELAVEPSGELLLRQAAKRGHTDLGWLRSYHSFSFGGYYDQRHMGFRSLRVINDDQIAGGRGFPTHPHRDMEIISYVLDGALQHRDSTGQGAIITPDDVQMMSAGTGITHSEYNPSPDETNHFLQIWIEPALRGVRPRYSDNVVTDQEKVNQWKLIAGPDDSGASVNIYQDAKIYAGKFLAGVDVPFTLQSGRHGWLQVATGSVNVNGTILKAGDAVASSMATEFNLQAIADADVLMFDLA